MSRVLHLAGDPRERGHQHGAQVAHLRPAILASMQPRLSALSQTGSDPAPYLDEILRVWEQHAPATLQMMHGIAETLALDWQEYFLYITSPYWMDRMQLRSVASRIEDACTVWAASGTFSRDGAPLLAKNRDNHPDQRPLQCVARVQPDHGYAYLCLTTAGTPGVSSSGINAVGLAVADTHVSSRDVGPGIGRYSVMMDLLENCARVEEAIEYVPAHPYLGSGTLCLVDAQGEMAVVELAHSAQAVLRPALDFIVSTNHYTAPQTRMLWQEHALPHLRGNSIARRARVEQALLAAQGAVDVAWSQRLMAEHGGAMDAICRHPELNPDEVTISTALFAPREGGMVLADGFPCRMPFEFFKVSA